MKGLIQKSGYIKPGSGGGHYAEYIATRDGVEVMEPAAGGYLEYMAQRPRSHGLFSADVPADLEQTMEEINAHAGPVWTFIYSLKREDAARLGYENGESWRRLLLAHQTELAAAMKIPPSSFRWRATFHDEKHHPHIHMMAWSADPRQGYLTEKGIEQMRSQLSNDIFQDELLYTVLHLWPLHFRSVNYQQWYLKIKPSFVGHTPFDAGDHLELLWQYLFRQ